MAVCETNRSFALLDPDLDPTSVGPRFRKYLERFKVYGVAMNIKDKARNRALFLHCAGPKAPQDIFETLDDTGEDFETTAEKLLEYFEPKQHCLSVYIYLSAVNAGRRGILQNSSKLKYKCS